MQMQLLVHREKRLDLSYFKKINNTCRKNLFIYTLLQCIKCNIIPEQHMRVNNNQNTNLKLKHY